MRCLLYGSGITLLTFLGACDDRLSDKCEDTREWKVQNYRIVESRCPDLVLAFGIRYTVYNGAEREAGGASRVDSCLFTWQAGDESFFRFDVCDNTVQELKPDKVPLDKSAIDSVTIFSKATGQIKPLTRKQIERLADDWNNSTPCGYSDKPADSAFYPAYQYKLAVFSKDTRRTFYGFNFLMLDSTNWTFKMNKSENLEYFHDYWKN